MGLLNSLKKITQIFIKQLPDEGGQSNTNDEALVIKTSPTIWEYEMFRLEWDRRTILREIDLMLKSDTRIKRANHVFASTAVRKGITVTCTSDASNKIAGQAQEVINDLMRDCQINAKLLSWARILLKDGDLMLNPIIDLKERKIKNIKRLPALTIQRLDDMTGNFPDVNKAFRQIDPISLQTIMEFPLWCINHIRYDHEEGDRYGNSQYLACRGYWKKLNMTEEDLVVRRRTRAPLRRFHSIGNKDNPSDWSEVEKYKDTNKLNAKTTQVTTDYFGNGLTDVKNLQGDDKIDDIKDIEHLQEVYMIGTGVPLNILGFGQNVTRNGPVDTQEEQFKQDVQELQGLIEYGDSSPYSGLRFIFDFALALAGINPLLVDYSVRWFENDNETANDRVDRVIKLRSSQPSPLVSKKLALTIVSKDLGLENDDAIKAELKAIKEEMKEDKTEQSTLETELNPENPSTASISRSTVSASGKPVTDSKKKETFFPLHGKYINTLEKQFTKDFVKLHKSVFLNIKPELQNSIGKVETLRGVYADAKDVPDKVPKLAAIILEQIGENLGKNKNDLLNTFLEYYKKSSEYGRSNAAKDIGVDISTDFINPNVQSYFLSEAGSRIDGIYDTTMNELRNQLFVAYTNHESSQQWMSRIEGILNCNSPKGRAEMIARTELAFAYNTGLIKTYEELGTHQVRWLAVMDNRTCPTCKANNDEVFKLNELPDLPAHPRCRCTIVSADDE